MSVYGGIDYSRFLMVSLRPWRVLPKDQYVTATFPSGSPNGSEVFVEVDPPEGYAFVISYFKLTTPEEVQGNILVTGLDGVEERLLYENQAENLADQIYDSSDWAGPLVLKKFRLYGIVTADATTADRELILKWSGGLVPRVV